MIETKFKNTEIGLIPEDWEVKTIGDFTEVVTGATPSTTIVEYWNNGTIPWMNSGEVNLKFVSNVEGRITELGLQNSSTHMIPPNCVLIGLAGQGKTRGTCAYNLIPLCTNQSIGSILPGDKFHSLYLYYYMDSKYDDLRLLSAGDGGRGGLNKGILLNYLIPLPPLPEQRRIAEVLSQADELIKQWENVIAKKRDIKTATMQLLLTGKKRLNGFDKPWVEKKLGEVGGFIAGNGFPIEYQGEKNAKYPFYKVSDFNNENNDNYLDIANNYISDEIAKKLHCNIIPKGSIVFAKIGAAIFLERKRIVEKDCCIDNNMQSFQLYEGNDNHYILYVLKTISFGCLVSASALPALKVVDLNNVSIFLPSDLSEQRAIAEILSDMDEEIKTLEAKVEKLRNIKCGMMQQLLSGKIRLVGEDAGNVKQFVENNFGQMPYAAEDEAEFGL